MGVTGLITHHKVAVTAPQPRFPAPIEAVNGTGDRLSVDMAEFAALC
jgi:hypothetical protein